MPLLVEEELGHPAPGKLRGQFFAGSLDRPGLAPRQRRGPVVPAGFRMPAAESIKENKIFQPPVVLLAKVIEFRFCASRSTCQKIGSRLPQQGKLLSRRLLTVQPLARFAEATQA